MDMVLSTLTVAHGAPSLLRAAWGKRPSWDKHSDTAHAVWRQLVSFQRPRGCAVVPPALKQLSRSAGAGQSARRAPSCSPSGAQNPTAAEPSAVDPSRDAGGNGSDPKQQPALPVASWRQQKPQQLGPKPAPSGPKTSGDRAADMPPARLPGPPARQATKQGAAPLPGGNDESDAAKGETLRHSPSSGAVRPPRPTATGTSLQGPPARKPARALVMHLPTSLFAGRPPLIECPPRVR